MQNEEKVSESGASQLLELFLENAFDDDATETDISAATRSVINSGGKC